MLGRKSVYALVAAIMIVGALSSAFANGFEWLVVTRFILGLGIGGDYPVSAVLMSEYANRDDRGRLNMTWRLLLGLGAVPAAAVVYLRTKIPESPRFQSSMRGKSDQAARELAKFSAGVIHEPTAVIETPRVPRVSLRQMLSDRRILMLLLGTAGSWFLFDYAYYGNTLSLPAILNDVAPNATLVTKLAWSLGVFVLFAAPGYLLAFTKMDRIGHRRLQLIGFGVMSVAFLMLGAIPVLTSVVAPFLIIFGLSYFFIEFGPNTTTFVLPSEFFPVSMRTTAHGISAGIGKLGAFIGVFLVPVLQRTIGLRGLLLVASGSAVLGYLLTLVLPEPARRSLEEVSGEDRPTQPAEYRRAEETTPEALEPAAREAEAGLIGRIRARYPTVPIHRSTRSGS